MHSKHKILVNFDPRELTLFIPYFDVKHRKREFLINSKFNCVGVSLAKTEISFV
jgi:hypothetical protein